MRARQVLPLAVAGLLAGCGAGGDERRAVQREPQIPLPTAPAPPPPAAVPPELEPPRHVPRTGDGRPAEAAQAGVIRRWAAALRRGDLPGAARLFALPSRFQNATPVLTIDSARERLAIHRALPCGGLPLRMERAGRFTVVLFRLTERPGGRCAGGTGNTARSAIRVSGGRIVEWYRLLEPPARPPVAGEQHDV